MSAFRMIICYCFFLYSCKSVATDDCRKYTTGNFTLNDEKNSRSFLIKRNKSTQQEIEQPSGKESEWKITWLDDCKYSLTLLSDDYGILRHSEKPPTYTFEIIDATGEYYVFKKEISFLSKSYVDTIWRSK